MLLDQIIRIDRPSWPSLWTREMALACRAARAAWWQDLGVEPHHQPPVGVRIDLKRTTKPGASVPVVGVPSSIGEAAVARTSPDGRDSSVRSSSRATPRPHRCLLWVQQRAR